MLTMQKEYICQLIIIAYFLQFVYGIIQFSPTLHLDFDVAAGWE